MRHRELVRASRRSGLAAAVALVFALGCGRSLMPLRAPETGATVVSSDTALAFQRRADGFYMRLAHRRFNTLETFNDFILRDHFRTPDLFFDYYADLAQSLDEAHFDKSRPLDARLDEFLFENERVARVRVRLVGLDGRPLRPGKTRLVRVDRWEFVDGSWWILPGKL